MKAVGKINALRGMLMVLAGSAWLCGFSGGAFAQGWWPWSQPDSPRPKANVNRPPPAPIPPDQGGPRPQSGMSICVQLEQRLVAETQRGGQSRSQLPRIEDDIRQTERSVSQAQAQLDRGDCYDYFLFAKSLRRTPACVQAASALDSGRRRLSELSIQRQQTMGSSESSYQDDIIRELARNGCGKQWEQEASRRDNSFGSLFGGSEDDTTQGGYKRSVLPFATYRTVCVRLCDGYFFPVSYSTVQSQFDQDAEQCQSRCAAPVELYFYQTPNSDNHSIGGEIRQATSVKTQTPYANLKTAFRYTKEYVQGCSCKDAEYIPSAGDKKAEAVPPNASTAASAQPVRQR